ncbi:NADPH-dependent FMN reductase [Crossiella sp. CA198]|uniref:NADPH-dependent FMN reductase n=1 Tax=Crossiella sp. CA198 TaxID=3455607 RepID=UPI003F8D1B52
MSNTPLRVAVIVASTRQGRFGSTVARWFDLQAGQHPGLEIEILDLAETPLPVILGGDLSTEDSAILAPVTGLLERADAYVVLTPEYNHSYPAALKNLIDWHYTQWRAKPVGFVSYGGLGGGLRAVEHLRPVFAELHAVTIRDGVSFHSPWTDFDAEANHRDQEGCASAAKLMLDQLAWWGRALRTARAELPYSA